MTELSEPQLKSLDEQKGQPLELVDPRSNQTYVLLKSELYNRIRGIIEGEDDLSGIDVGRLIAEAMKDDDENDPLLESYQKYKKRP